MPTSPHAVSAPPHRLSTPRAAAVAGVVFAVLFAITLILVRVRMPGNAADSARWLQSQHGTITTATVLMPFAGISFLWFIGVVRDGFGRSEDRFFLSIFLGSGLLFLAMMFVATVVAAGLLSIGSGAADPAAHAEVLTFGRAIVISASQTYALRMAAVFMTSLGTIWLKTGLMPRWLAALTYLLAVALLIAGDTSRWTTLAFPAWVFVVSILILVRSGRGDEFEPHTP
ncbi:hypothetical protein K7711_39665 [Nocardia sp. CA2R105]|uniref:hypothetical protein n=1 Tax=Nocardia coffeae TaxID=2873381 RepID=UPI001CA5FFA4|nr:hypothetical protein [Nocardia coffeae]MBY8862643.1 hypothetical protein [Nocardia coffeae]